MVGWDDFIVGLITDLVGAAVVSVPIYFLFTRRERKKERKLESGVLEGLNRLFNQFIASIVYNTRKDVLEPLGYLASIMDAPVAPFIIEMETLQSEVSQKARKNDVVGMLEARKKQWKIILSDNFRLSMQKVVGQ
jgi:hypothetical protein